MDSVPMAALISMARDYERHQTSIAVQEATMQQNVLTIAAQREEIAAGEADKVALAEQVEALSARWEELKRHVTPEERAFQVRMQEMRATYGRFEQALQVLQTLHQHTLSEQAAIVRRQLGGDLGAL
jgi:hypothetical protein